MKIDNKKLNECCNFEKLNEIGKKNYFNKFHIINIFLIPLSAKS